MSEEVPLFIVEGADGAGLDPTRDAVEVEGVVAHAPRSRALFVGVGHLVGLALDARLVDVVLADGAVLHGHVYTINY